ncbi:MAG: DUF3563 family protein [Paracoccaceae bacterium]
MFEMLLSALRGLRPVPAAERERAYLNASVSLYDLERRQREIDLARFGKGALPY